MLYSLTCTCNIVGAEDRRVGGRSSRTEDKDQGLGVEEHNHPLKNSFLNQF